MQSSTCSIALAYLNCIAFGIVKGIRLNELYLQVRHIELKKEKNVERERLVKFLEDAMSTQFRNPSIWIQDAIANQVIVKSVTSPTC